MRIGFNAARFDCVNDVATISIEHCETFLARLKKHFFARFVSDNLVVWEMKGEVFRGKEVEEHLALCRLVFGVDLFQDWRGGSESRRGGCVMCRHVFKIAFLNADARILFDYFFKDFS